MCDNLSASFVSSDPSACLLHVPCRNVRRSNSFNTILTKSEYYNSIFFYFARCNSETRPRPLFCNSCATVTLHAHRWHVTYSFLCVIQWKAVVTITLECKTSSREASSMFLHRSSFWTKSPSSQKEGECTLVTDTWSSIIPKIIKQKTTHLLGLQQISYVLFELCKLALIIRFPI